MGRCGFCDWYGPHPWQIQPVTPEEAGAWQVRLNRASTVCPRCRRPRLELVGLWDQFGNALREADLTAEEIELFADALATWPDEASPDELADKHPFAAPLIEEAKRSGGVEWKYWLTVALAALAMYVAHRDADAQIEAAKTASPPTQTRNLNEEDIARIVAAAQDEFEAREAARDEQKQRQPARGAKQRRRPTP
jgi:hypothetical protein